jgi:hypothetical protein
LKNAENVVKWLEIPGKNLGLRVNNLGLVYVNIDNPVLAAKVMKMYINNRNVLITTSPRGAHFFFKVPDDERTRSGKAVSILCRGGFAIELRSNFITFAGENYNLLSPKDLSFANVFTNLAYLPDFFKPLNVQNDSVIPPLTKENDFTILEGSRNNTLHQWGTELRRDKFGISYDRKKEILQTMNFYFLSASLPEAEIDPLVNSIEKFDRKVGDDFENTGKTPYRLVELIITKWKDDFHYD